MLKLIDRFLDRITMYRLVLYFLIFVIVAAIGLSAIHQLPYEPHDILFSAVYLAVIAWITEKVFSAAYRIPANIESSHITALILALLIAPADTLEKGLFLTAAAVLAIASKYILTWRGKHIFNPAAIAVVFTAWGPQQSASWWVGTTALLPFVVAGGLLIVRKIRRMQMVLLFLGVALAMTAWVSFLNQGDPVATLQKVVLHSSLFFLGFVMLTEPLTAPANRSKQLWYAVLVGMLFPPQLHIAGVYFSPELGLVIGNLFAFVVSPMVKVQPRLVEKIHTGPASADYIFALDKPLQYKPGQYMEWTLGHLHADSRGNRRIFTLASSPTEDMLRIGVKFYPNGSSYKKAMLAIHQGTKLSSGQLAGDFTLPDDSMKKLAFIAGGIGVTPFRSMLKYLVDIQQSRDITMLYAEKQPEAFVYSDVFAGAQQHGIKVIRTITDVSAVPSGWQELTGTVGQDMIQQAIPDYQERLFYISGPHEMVVATKKILLKLNVPRHHIKTDHFTGYA